MHFPDWVDNPMLSDDDRARARLRYLVQQAAAKIDPKARITELTTRAQIDRTTLFYALRKGQIGQRLAEKLEAGAGNDANGKPILPAKYLTSPLSL